MTRPARAPQVALTKPAIGPPIGVEPRKATAHSAMTRPRISGADASCSVLLPLARKLTLAAPTNAIATSSTAKLGATAAAISRAPKITEVVIQGPDSGTAPGGRPQ